MRLFLAFLKWFFGLAILAVLGLAAWLYAAPPALIKLGAGYAAKIVCSNVLLAGRDADEVLRVDVQAPGHPLLKLMSVKVDEANEHRHRRAPGRLRQANGADARGRAWVALRFPTETSKLQEQRLERSRRQRLCPMRPGLRATGSMRRRIPTWRRYFDDPALVGPGMRAVVIVRDGRIVGERYGEGFSAETPLLGWSMTKTVTAAIIGTVVGDGKMAVADKDLFASWTDGRSAISAADLMAMSSGLEFNEEYGDVTDVTRMLYLEPDMAAYAVAKPLTGEIGSVFSYSSGTTLILTRLWQDRVGDGASAWPRTKLFEPIGMSSAVMEMDARGTFAGSSYLYATARDWARFGQLLLQDGVWNGTAILPPGFVAWMREEAPASKGVYGRGQLWLQGPEGDVPPGDGPRRWLRPSGGYLLAGRP